MKKIEDIEKQVKEIQSIDFANLPADKINEIVDKLMGFVDEGEEFIINEIQANDDNEADNS
jgi:hypothetical protein